MTKQYREQRIKDTGWKMYGAIVDRVFTRGDEPKHVAADLAEKFNLLTEDAERAVQDVIAHEDYRQSMLQWR